MGLAAWICARPDGPVSAARERDGKGNHPAALGHPGGGRLFKDGPEGNDEDKDGEDFQDVPGVLHGGSSAALLRILPAPVEQDDEEHFPEAGAAVVAFRRRSVVLLAAQPEDEGGDAHENARNGKRPTVPVMLFHGRNDQEGEEGAQVDSPVKGIEGLGHQLRGFVRNLVPHEGGDAGLDASRAQRDDEQARHQDVTARFNGMEEVRRGQDSVPYAVKQGNVKNGLVPAPDLVRQPCARQGKQVNHSREDVKGGGGPVFAHQQVARHVQHEDGLHAVEAEAFAGFRSDDVPGLGGRALMDDEGGRGAGMAEQGQ